MKDEKLAAGGVVVDAQKPDAPLVLVVHRQRYDDWSFPKGGVKPGETIEEAALREVKEETGVECSIIRKLSAVRYYYRTRKGKLRPKVVYYFVMEAKGGVLSAEGDEVDVARWLEIGEAKQILSHKSHRDLLDLVFQTSRQDAIFG